ncbi:MAG: DUF512 domain-containing protein, partial [Defluviitaleaceae bacterium]|nr:DUF512 domain-containing protein [Defluviitaleaceae bacterium]
ASIIMEQIEKIAKAGIETNFQIVLCKGINDKNHLDKTIEDLGSFLPDAGKLSIVPLGISAHRENLPFLERFNKEDAREIIAQVTKWQEKFKKEHGTSFVFLADEFYLLAELPFPHYDHYEGYHQLENGIGMLKCFEEEFYEEFSVDPNFLSAHETIRPVISIVTGTSAYDFIKSLCEKIEESYDIKINVHKIINNFYGETITVSGLLTGGDIINQLKGKALGERVFIPMNALKASEEIFLDDVSVSDIEKALKIKVKPIEIDGGKFLKGILKHSSCFLVK